MPPRLLALFLALPKVAACFRLDNGDWILVPKMKRWHSGARALQRGRGQNMLGVADYLGDRLRFGEFSAHILCSRNGQLRGVGMRVPRVLPKNATAKPYRLGKFLPLHPRRVWQSGLATLLQKIRRGTIYQANLTRQLLAPFAGCPRALFAAMCRHIPAPHAAFLRLPGGQVLLSASPEHFVSVSSSGRMNTQPIKGTRPRSRFFLRDAWNRLSLLRSAKEQAELAMIADLLRNDLSAAGCRAGTVRVEKPRAVLKTPSVWHTFASITGQLSPTASARQALAHMLPAGSIAGCPKRCAVQILRNIEPHERGLFCGVLAFFPRAGGAQSSVLIRSILIEKDKALFQVGGGITHRSTEHAEFAELQAKSAPFLGLANG